MFEKFLRAGAAFDWFTPTYTLVMNAKRGPTATYAIPVNYHGGPAGIRRLMKQHGIEVWGADIYDDETIIHARASDAGVIESILDACGIPHRGGPR